MTFIGLTVIFTIGLMLAIGCVETLRHSDAAQGLSILTGVVFLVLTAVSAAVGIKDVYNKNNPEQCVEQPTAPRQ